MPVPMHLRILTIAWKLIGLASSAAICSNYTLIDTRGTGAAQGPSPEFITMNQIVLGQMSGGKVYNTVYPASQDQISSAGTQDIVNYIVTTLASSPNECFILEGYSQGATATVNALPRLVGASFAAVQGVFLVGDPVHKSGLSCNVDNHGAASTRDVNGVEAVISSGISSNWVPKTLDVCIFGDGVCDTRDAYGETAQHLEYANDSSTQNMGATFIIGKLRGSV